MNYRTKIMAAGAGLAGLLVVPGALAAAPAPGSGPHGCALQDVNGTTTPVVHQSDTSTIGGNTCTFTQVATDDPTGDGGNYVAAAQSWSITTYTITPGPTPGTVTRTPDPAHSFSSAAGSSPHGEHVIPPGEQADVTVSNGTIIVGTGNGAPGT